jgi:hypothetical protein
MLHGTELSALLRNQLVQAQRAVDVLDPDTLLAANPEVLVEELVRTYIPRDVLVRWEDASRSEVRETRITRRDPFRDGVFVVAASEVKVSFPIDGDPQLLGLRASSFNLAPETLLLAGDSLHLEVIGEQLSAEIVAARIERLRSDVDQRAAWVNSDLGAFRVESAVPLRAAVDRRRQRVLADRALDAALTIPVRATGTARPIVPARPKQVSLQTRRHQAGFVPEPVLDESIFQDVLSAIRSWAKQMERAPGTAAKLDEEELRDLILGVLNAYWEGAAGGELFNGSGKTDILIREGDRNAFIAECKVWSGPKAVSSAIDQLLSYMVWRDSKASLIYFIRTVDPDATIAKLVAAVEAHPNHVLTKTADTATSTFEFVFTADEEGRRISLAVIPVVLRHRS